MNKILFKILYGCMVIWGISSCIPYRNLVYLNEGKVDLDKTKAAQYYKTYPYAKNEDYRVQSADILSITLNTLQESTADYFRGISSSGASSSGSSSQMNQNGQISNPYYFQGFLVNDSGFVNLPVIGKQDVKGKTTTEIEQQLEKELSAYLKFTTVKVRLANFSITVLGEVTNPGIRFIFEKEATLLQVLGGAGTVPLSNLSKVRVIRENTDGRQVAYLDLTNPDIIASEFFYMRPGDIVIVQPVKKKVIDINASLLGLGVSILSLIILISSRL